MSAKILIVDDHEVVREGVRTLITREKPQWDVCGEAKSAQEAVEACRVLRPDITVLDITMPGMSGLEVASSIFDLGSRVLMFTMHESEHLATEVSQAGAQGFVLKSQAGKDLIRAIERLLGGGTFFGSESNPQENAPSSDPPSGRLAERSLDGRIPIFWPAVRSPLSWCPSY
jgi:DNA-binding NarL/FixJ family response regulator